MIKTSSIQHYTVVKSIPASSDPHFRTRVFVSKFDADNAIAGFYSALRSEFEGSKTVDRAFGQRFWSPDGKTKTRRATVNTVRYGDIQTTLDRQWETIKRGRNQRA
ncbi:hypothetical protein DDT56_07320 [Brenneria corticis]|uniref:Uncharacterized protein n=1 Tax=Brenneria corticis TaxID=2173106 RepID=A0A2U1U6Y2_9GAMM|nr:hypothetical protein DDT56_07320 [Brenneria sp. CFCC 11842]